MSLFLQVFFIFRWELMEYISKVEKKMDNFLSIYFDLIFMILKKKKKKKEKVSLFLEIVFIFRLEQMGYISKWRKKMDNSLDLQWKQRGNLRRESPSPDLRADDETNQ